MFDRLTDRAREVIELAGKIACEMNHKAVGGEHILLGLIDEGSGVAANVLHDLDIDLSALRASVESILPFEAGATDLEVSPENSYVKHLTDQAILEARGLCHNYVGTEHLLLALVKDGDSAATQVLARFGASGERIYKELVAMLGQSPGAVSLRDEDVPMELRDKSPPPRRPAKADILRRLDNEISQLEAKKDAALCAFEFVEAATLHSKLNRFRRLRDDIGK
jgi:ATP-dependent Clp protease ATP-binding subunit ClpC